MKFKEVEGDLIRLTLEGNFDVITHGCNCFQTMTAGIAPQMEIAFGALERDKLFWNNCQENYNVFQHVDLLGNINWWQPYKDLEFPRENCPPKLIVINSYTQYNFGSNHKNDDIKPLDYEALTLCMRKINKTFKGKHIGLPLIGCGLAGGNWFVVKQIIRSELKDMDVTVVHYDRNS